MNGCSLLPFQPSSPSQNLHSIRKQGVTPSDTAWLAITNLFSAMPNIIARFRQQMSAPFTVYNRLRNAQVSVLWGTRNPPFFRSSEYRVHVVCHRLGVADSVDVPRTHGSHQVLGKYFAALTVP